MSACLALAGCGALVVYVANGLLLVQCASIVIAQRIAQHMSRQLPLVLCLPAGSRVLNACNSGCTISGRHMP